MNDLRLLILCSRPCSGSDLSRDIESLLNQGVAWDSFLRRVGEEGATPLAYHHLKSLGRLVPFSVLSKLRSSYLWNSARNLSFFAKLKPVAESVSRAGLRAAVTKGARLAIGIYGDPGLRFFVDIDFVVHHRDWLSFRKILEDHDFHTDDASERLCSVSPMLQDWTFRPLYRKRKLALEIHFDYLGLQIPFSSEQDLWASTRWMEWDGVPIRVLSPEYELCYLCCHAQQHSYSRLIWITDIAALALNGGLDWEKVQSICRREYISAPVFYSLYLAGSLWPGTVPESVLAGFRLSVLEKKTLSFSWPVAKVAGRQVGVSFPYYAPTLFSLWARKKIGLIMKTLLHIFFPSREWMAYSFGISRRSPRIFGLYAWRLMKPVVAVGKRLLRIE